MQLRRCFEALTFKSPLSLFASSRYLPLLSILDTHALVFTVAVTRHRFCGTDVRLFDAATVPLPFINKDGRCVEHSEGAGRSGWIGQSGIGGWPQSAIA